MMKSASKKYEYICAAVCMIVGLFLAASFLSFYPRDDSFYSVSFPPPEATSRWGGAVGAEWAAHGIFQLGLAAFLMPLFFVGLSMILAKGLRRVKAISLFCFYVFTGGMFVIYVFDLLRIPFQIDGFHLCREAG